LQSEERATTGGLTNKLPGRIADTPIVGVGVYANGATCAVSSNRDRRRLCALLE